MSRKKRLWPTATVNGNNNRKGVSKTSGDGLSTAVKLYPTPKASKVGGYSSPEFRPTLEQVVNQESQLTSSPGVSPASLIRLQESVKALLMSVISGRSSGVSLAKLSPDGSWLKTYQGSFQAMLDGSLEPFSLTWPRWGTLLDGVLSGLSMWERGTEETECSLWPTPQSASDSPVAHNQINGTLKDAVRRFPTPSARDWKSGENKNCWDNARPLNEMVKLIPTPTSPRPHDNENTVGKDYPSQNQDNLARRIATGGQLNPTWVEWLMGFPTGWTDLKDSETP